MRRDIQQSPWKPTVACFYVSCFTEDPGDLSLLYVTVPFMTYIDHQGVPPLLRQVHYHPDIFTSPYCHRTWLGRDLIHSAVSIRFQLFHTLKISDKDGQQSGSRVEKSHSHNLPQLVYSLHRAVANHIFHLLTDGLLNGPT